MGARLDSAPIGKSEKAPKMEEKKAVADAVGGGGGSGGSEPGLPTVDSNDPDADLFARFAKLNE